MIMNWYVAVLKKYAEFNGRARRTEFWMFVLFNFIFGIAAIIIDNVIGLTFEEQIFGTVYLLYNLAVLIPSLAVCVRRLHDTGKTGWWILISLIPLVGEIWLIILCATEGTPGENIYGPNPKEVQANPA
jgi:uncharacterized membrane protein YhaH (DUF805 family)